MVMESIRSALNYPGEMYTDKKTTTLNGADALDFAEELEENTTTIQLYTDDTISGTVDYITRLDESRDEKNVYEVDIERFSNRDEPFTWVRMEAELPSTEKIDELPEAPFQQPKLLSEPLEVIIHGESPYSWQETVEKLI
ncbi:MAG: hypothetical protein H8Z69_01635 [Nanohaloarchaea archaeon]|nr:hypothetical protein [Candidatus Nanohaloarchaea archaeon]